MKTDTKVIQNCYRKWGWGCHFRPLQQSRISRIYVCVALIGTLLSASGQDRNPRSQPASSPLVQTDPAKVSAWLQQRKTEQIAAAQNLRVFHDFQFVNRLQESGITFESRAVADANKYYKAIHYDHGTGLAIADVDSDGRLDIYFVSQLGGNQLWRNAGNGRFENITETSGTALKDRISASAAFADIDNDGDPDLFVTTVRFGNALFENLGSGRFRDITTDAGVGYVGHSSGAVFFDFDNDGFLDLFVTNVGRYTTDERGAGGYFVGFKDGFRGHLHPERAEQSILYKNLGARKFRDVSKDVGLQDMSWSGDATFADLNQETFPDLYVLNMQGDDHYYENQAGKRFVAKTAEIEVNWPSGTKQRLTSTNLTLTITEP